MSSSYVDRSKLSANVHKLAILEDRTGVEELKHQGKLLMRDLIKITPPTSPYANESFEDNAKGESLEDQRKIGQAAVNRDIAKNWRSANSIVRELQARNPKAAKSLANYIRTGDIAAVQRMLQKLGWKDWNRVVLSVSEADHNKNRSSRTGRAIGSTTYVLRSNSIIQLARTKLGHVGAAKGGWATPAIALGAEVPAWIAGHATPGIYAPMFDGDKKSLTMGNLVPYGGHLVPGRLINNALKMRQRSMEQRIAYKLRATVH